MILMLILIMNSLSIIDINLPICIYIIYSPSVIDLS